MSTRCHQKCLRKDTLWECPREVTHFEKKCPRDVIVHEMSPSPEIGIVNWSVDFHTHQNVVTNLWQIFHCKCTALLPAEFSELNQITNLMTFDLSRNIMLSQITQIYIILLACIKRDHGFHCMKVWNHCTMYVVGSFKSQD